MSVLRLQLHTALYVCTRTIVQNQICTIYHFFQIFHLHNMQNGVTVDRKKCFIFVCTSGRRYILHSDVASGWVWWALAHPEFGSSFDPITTRETDYAHLITASPPGLENPAASLLHNITLAYEHLCKKQVMTPSVVHTTYID